ncbi:MAG: hypothetical protein EBQ95_02570 [Gammaproteobacteria bacterium]|nr:hypothetical protein [Gammaproteobacteria bacterium]
MVESSFLILLLNFKAGNIFHSHYLMVYKKSWLKKIYCVDLLYLINVKYIIILFLMMNNAINFFKKIFIYADKKP